MVLLLLIIGLFIGSFLGVLVDRLPRNETILRGRSHCDFCKKELKWYDLVPVISFISTKGRCRYCKRSLPLFYPIIEISTGILFVATYLFTIYYLPFTIYGEIVNSQLSIVNLLYYLFIVSGFIVIFFMDLRYGVILDKVLLPTALIVFLYLVLINQQLVIINLLSAIGAFSFFLIAALLFKIIRGKDGIGGGDIKLAFVLGLFLGLPNIVICLYLAFLTGAALGIILILWKKKNLQTATLPFGSFLILAALVTLFWGNFLYSKIILLSGL
jgi:leader peptidase (prepilin peptidase)/N-methyltransferase